MDWIEPMTNFEDPPRHRFSTRLALSIALPLVIVTAATAIFVTWHQAHSTEELVLEKARVGARLGARFYGLALEAAIDEDVLTVTDVFDDDYREIEGYEWGEHPKYHTRFDFYTDFAVLPFQEELMLQPDFVFAIGQDRNGYIPAHNVEYQQPMTGDPARDLVGNRSKRIFDDVVAKRAGSNTSEETLLQVYARDTGETMWDVSAPIVVKGEHWGAFRLAVSMKRQAERSRSLLLLLGGTFSALILVAVAVVVFVTRRAMRPVEELTERADLISMGEALDVPVPRGRDDEIGRLGRSVERLRLSMNAAMQRLGE